jgi:hypothetical protein
MIVCVRKLAVLLVALLVLVPSVAAAQATRDARVIVTVVDPQGGVIPGATVTLFGLEPVTKDSEPAPVQTSDKGVATIERVRLGRYSIQAKFDGFDLGLVRDVRFSAGDNRRVVMLPLKAMQETVTVGGGQEGAAARGTAAFGLSVTKEQIEALSDDPSELQRQIAELGGPDAVIRIDSFEGQQLPPKAQIKSIHVTRDQFAAETEQPGATFVDVITQAGIGPIRGSTNFNFRDGKTDGRNPFLAAGTRTPNQVRGYGFNIGGALIKEKADFSLSMNGGNNYSNPILNENKITGAPAQVLKQRQSSDYTFVNALFNYALTKDQTLRFGYSDSNQSFAGGMGGFDDPERGYIYDYRQRGFRIMEAGPIGRRIFINSRLSVNWTDQTGRSLVEKPTIMVLDAMNIGGAQVAGGTHSRDFTLESDVDYVRGIHSWRVGVKAVGGWYRTDSRNNYLGTYTFSSAADYAALKPALYTIETGNPAFSYFDMRGAFYIQDDIRVSRSLTLSPGLRYSAQTRIKDPGAFEPRFGMTWAPLKSGRTTIRASGGAFHGWLFPFIIQQAMRLDGTRQRQVIIKNPSFPDAGTAGAVTPPTKYLIGEYQLNQNVRYSAGVDQQITPRFRVSVIYSYWHMTQLPRGMQLNPLVNGVRQDPNFGNVVATVTDAEIRRHDVNTTFNLNLAPPGPAAAGPRFNWKRLTVNGGYSAMLPMRSGVGPFDVPPTGNLDSEWGRGPAHRRYLVNASITSTQLRNLSVNIGINLLDGQVYHETTGRDDNGDGFLNDRPEGVGLWSLRTDGQETVNMRVQYTFNMGQPAGPAQPRYRANVYVAINNLTNHANYTGYSGVVTSLNYMRPTAIQNPRTINMGMGFNF